MQNLNPGSQTPNRQQTECLLTNILSYRGSSKNFELDSPSLSSASIQPTWPHCQLTFAPVSGNIHICCCLFRCPGTGKRYLNQKETSCVPLQNTGFEPGVPDTKSPADWMLADKTTELSRIKQKTWTRQPVPMISKHSAHLTPQPFGIGTWLWRYTCLLLLISMLWHRQAIFNSKGDKLCSSAECRIWTWVPDTKSPADWMLADKPTELLRIKQKTWTRQPVPIISEHSAHLTPLSVDFRTCLWRYTYLLLLISMPLHRQAIFKSKGDKLLSSAEYRIRTHQGLRHQIASRLNACWQTDWAIEDQAKNLNSTAHPHDQPAFSPLDPTVSWLSHLALAIYMFVVNFDALA